MATWITGIIEGDTKKLCSVMVNDGGTPATAKPVSPQQCTSGAPQILKTYRPILTPKGETGTPKVNVAKTRMDASGDTVTYPARAIHIDGKPLRKVLNANSTGLSPSQQSKQKFDINTSKFNGAWYVTGIDGI